MRTVTRILVLITFITNLWRPAPMEGQEAVPVGVILQIVGPAYLRLAQGGEPVQLHPGRDIMRKLYAGQSLRVGLGGQIKLGLSTGTRVVDPSENWLVLEPAKGLTPEQEKVAQALRRYGAPGGTRGIGSSIISPAEGGVVRASQMVIRWTPSPTRGAVALRLETESGLTLWNEKNVDMSEGKLDSEPARRTLAEYQVGGGQESLILSMTDARGNESRVAFSLLLKSSEQDLENDLAQWQHVADPLIRSIGRAYEFNRRRLIVESAEEYEAALALAPESQDLVSAAIEAHRRTGNYPRAAELAKRIAANK